jgi:hypothetical protein
MWPLDLELLNVSCYPAHSLAALIFGCFLSPEYKFRHDSDASSSFASSQSSSYSTVSSGSVKTGAGSTGLSGGFSRSSSQSGSSSQAGSSTFSSSESGSLSFGGRDASSSHPGSPFGSFIGHTDSSSGIGRESGSSETLGEPKLQQWTIN